MNVNPDRATIEQFIIDAIGECSGAVKYCGLNAIRNLSLAQQIKDIDPGMAAFRGITAEEEAATALFFSVKNQGYKNAEKILFKDHSHKQALYPFLQSISSFIAPVSQHSSFPFETYQLRYATFEGRKAVKLHFMIKGVDKYVEPIPPLNFSITQMPSGKVHTFEKEFEALASGDSFSNVLKYVSDIANTRNKLLYATEAGMPGITNTDPFLEGQKKRVFRILTIVLLTDPWIREGRSEFVQQALDSFLLILKRIDETKVTAPTKII